MCLLLALWLYAAWRVGQEWVRWPEALAGRC